MRIEPRNCGADVFAQDWLGGHESSLGRIFQYRQQAFTFCSRNIRNVDHSLLRDPGLSPEATHRALFEGRSKNGTIGNGAPRDVRSKLNKKMTAEKRKSLIRRSKMKNLKRKFEDWMTIMTYAESGEPEMGFRITGIKGTLAQYACHRQKKCRKIN